MQDLLNKYKEIALLGSISGLVNWDSEVNLPTKAANARAEQQSLLTGLIVDRWNDPEFKKLLDAANSKNNLTPKEKAILRNLNRSARIYHKIPKKLLVLESETSSKAFSIWKKARENNDFKSFVPVLTKLIKISREMADCLGYKDNPYDALLDLYEPNLTAKFCEDIFNKLVPELSEIVKNSKSKPKPIKGNFPIDKQKELVVLITKQMGYDWEAGRMDTAPHPFEITLSHFDVRITNRYHTNDFRESLTGAMHEAGHAMYEQGINEKFEFTPLDHGVSLGIHESQSRFWENIIGRSKEFQEYATPLFKKHYPNLKNWTSKDFFDAFNEVKRTFIRVEADEVTYNLHIALRFEIENGLINGKIKPQDLPVIWNSKMKSYLGINPKNDSEGVLQDIHWAHNSFGYFPTYTLGNLYAAQWRNYMKKDIKNMNSLIKSGNFKPILAWLRENVHQHGSVYYPNELVNKITGEDLNPSYFLNYIKEKYQTES